jgi:hypothetical protein
MYVLFRKWKNGEPLTGVTEFFKEKFKDDKEVEADVYKDMDNTFSRDQGMMELSKLYKSEEIEDDEEEEEVEKDKVPLSAGVGVTRTNVVPKEPSTPTTPRKELEPEATKPSTITPSVKDKPEKIPVKPEDEEEKKKKKKKEMKEERRKRILKARIY